MAHLTSHPSLSKDNRSAPEVQLPNHGPIKKRRDVAQFGSAPCSGRGGRKFESCFSDRILKKHNIVKLSLSRVGIKKILALLQREFFDC